MYFFNGLPMRKQHHSNMPNTWHHAREPLYSNSAVIAVWLQSTMAHKILFWFTVIHSMSKFFTSNNFHDDFIFHLKLSLKQVSHWDASNLRLFRD